MKIKDGYSGILWTVSSKLCCVGALSFYKIYLITIAQVQLTNIQSNSYAFSSSNLKYYCKDLMTRNVWHFSGFRVCKICTLLDRSKGTYHAYSHISVYIVNLSTELKLSQILSSSISALIILFCRQPNLPN